MFHFWFNTFFVTAEETLTLDECGTLLTEDEDSVGGLSTTKMSVTRTQSDQTRVQDRIVAEQRRLHRQLNNELLRIARRVESNDHLNLPHSDLARPRARYVTDILLVWPVGSTDIRFLSPQPQQLLEEWGTVPSWGLNHFSQRSIRPHVKEILRSRFSIANQVRFDLRLTDLRST